MTLFIFTIYLLSCGETDNARKIDRLSQAEHITDSLTKLPKCFFDTTKMSVEFKSIYASFDEEPCSLEKEYFVSYSDTTLKIYRKRYSWSTEINGFPVFFLHNRSSLRKDDNEQILRDVNFFISEMNEVTEGIMEFHGKGVEKSPLEMILTDSISTEKHTNQLTLSINHYWYGGGGSSLDYVDTMELTYIKFKEYSNSRATNYEVLEND
jgi:hypothetical protein